VIKHTIYGIKCDFGKFSQKLWILRSRRQNIFETLKEFGALTQKSKNQEIHDTMYLSMKTHNMWHEMRFQTIQIKAVDFVKQIFFWQVSDYLQAEYFRNPESIWRSDPKQPKSEIHDILPLTWQKHTIHGIICNFWHFWTNLYIAVDFAKLKFFRQFLDFLQRKYLWDPARVWCSDPRLWKL